MVAFMADEYYERYKHLSHQELYRSVQSGSSHQVDSMADSWASTGDTIGAIAATLQADLKRLLPDWTSQGSREFHYRLELIVRYAQSIADEASAMRTGLTIMASSLRDAQRRAESPSDSAFSVGDLINGVVGASLGRVVPVAARAQAHERMVRVVAKLAADYGVAEHGRWPVMLPEAPIDLPAATIGSGLASGVGLVATQPSHRGHGRHRDHGHRDHRDDRDRGHRSSSGAPSATSTGHLYHGALGSAVIGGGSGWSQYSRPVHLAGHAIGVDMSVGPHSASGGGGGSGGAGGSSGSSGSGSGGSSSGASGSGGAGGSGGSGAGTGATGATMGGGGGAGGAMPMAPLGGGVAPAAAAGGAAPGGGGAIGGGGGVTPAERAWHVPEAVDWADPDDDATPSVLGG
jgi:hypothetical protein